ncbi:LAGLIDADG family homing endonuclease, partial [Candidatus Woesearchaeota archaeon]|nr:LAGLIDADG family homing endonuclease [Candidatus Woesearchaeota archaeon]
IETEGSIINYGSKKSPIVSITSASKRFITQLERLLRDLKYNPYIYSHNIKDHELRIQGLESIGRLHYNIYPYFNHPSKKSKFLETLKEKSLIRLKIENNQEIINMIKSARDITAMSKNINKDLAEHINLYIENIFKHEIKRYNVNGWINSHKSVALLPFLMICKILKTDHFKFIPKHYASILWANNLFSKEELNRIREAR